MNLNKCLLSFALTLISFTLQAAPPALITSSFTKHEMGFEQCQQRAKDILLKMNLDIEDHGSGTIGGFGEQSVAVVNCHRLDDTTYVQIAVASQKDEAAQTIMNYLVSYLRSNPTTGNNPGNLKKPAVSQ